MSKQGAASKVLWTRGGRHVEKDRSDAARLAGIAPPTHVESPGKAANRLLKLSGRAPRLATLLRK